MLYRYDRNDRAYSLLLEIAGPNFFGKDAGEVAFAVFGAVATIETLPRLSESLKWAKLVHVPVMRNEITIEHRGNHESTLTNSAGPALQWKVSFPALDSGKPAHIAVDGVLTQASLERRANRQPVVTTVVSVGPAQSRSARYLA